MEEFKPKRKNTAQPAQNGQSAPHTRKPRTPKPQGENAANAQHKPRPRRPRPAAPATAEQNAAAQSIPAPRPRRPRQNQNSVAPQNGQAAAPRPQGQRRGRRPKNPEHLEMTPAIPMHICPLGGLGEVGKNITLYVNMRFCWMCVILPIFFHCPGKQQSRQSMMYRFRFEEEKFLDW